MTSPTGIATAAASVRAVAPPQAIPTLLDELTDRLGALEVTACALVARLNPILRAYDADPSPGATAGREPADLDLRSDTTRRLEAITRGFAILRDDLERTIDRLEV